MSFDGKAFGEEIVGIVRGYVEQSLGPVLKRLEELEKAPKPEPVDMAAVGALVDDRIKAIPTPDVSAETLEAAVQKAVSALPPPEAGKPGTSVTIDEVRPLIEDAVKSAVSAIPVPKDGLGAASAMIDREGNLTLTMTDGSTRALGPVVGKDADMAAIKQAIEDHFKALPKPEDGKDGFGFEDLTVEFDGERTATLKFVKGERVKEFPLVLPIVIDRGVYKDGGAYVRGDGVTWGGSFWIAQKETSAKPGDGAEWRLAVKKGRDGKEVVKSEPAAKPVKAG